MLHVCTRWVFKWKRKCDGHVVHLNHAFFSLFIELNSTSSFFTRPPTDVLINFIVYELHLLGRISVTEWLIVFVWSGILFGSYWSFIRLFCPILKISQIKRTQFSFFFYLSDEFMNLCLNWFAFSGCLHSGTHLFLSSYAFWIEKIRYYKSF